MRQTRPVEKQAGLCAFFGSGAAILRVDAWGGLCYTFLKVIFKQAREAGKIAEIFRGSIAPLYISLPEVLPFVQDFF